MREASFPPSFANGLSAFRAGGKDEALRIFREVLRWHPGAEARAVHLMGMLEHKAGDLPAASAWWRRAIALDPAMPEPHAMLGRSLAEAGQTEEAIAVLGAAVGHCPSSGLLWFSAASLLAQAGRMGEAAEAAHRSAQLDPTPDRLLLLGQLFQSIGRFAESQEMLEAVRRQFPENAQVAHLLGVALRKLKRPSEAKAMDEEALRLAPSRADFHYELAQLMLVDMGDPEAAEAAMERALACDPGHARCHSHLLLARHYRWQGDPAGLRQEHAAWADRHGRFPPLCAGGIPAWAGRRLRVGYISGDLYGTHPVVSFFEGIARHHDRGAFEVFIYADIPEPNPTTDRVLALADGPRSVWTLSDERLAAQVQGDRVDILVDLGGHAGRRMGVFARKPAPIQATYLGYPDTTGLPAMDYRIVDAVTDPSGDAEAWCTEKLVRLPGCFLTYRPPDFAPPVSPPPCEANGFVTFASFNMFAKLTPAWAARAAAVLGQVPDSRLLLKSAGFIEADEVRARLERLFAGTGVDMRRILFQAEEPDPRKHLPHYARADIALDAFPYHGTTTTCEALWMGVPVVTLAGRPHMSRVGASLLGAVGLGDLVAQTPEEFVATAVALANDRARLGALRWELRRRMAPLLDERAFVRKLEDAYRGMAGAGTSKP